MKVLRLCQELLFLLLACTAPAATEVLHRNGGVLVLREESPGRVVLSLRNTNTADITATFHLTLSNTVAQPSGPITLACAPGQTRRAVSLTPRDAGLPWNYRWKFAWTWGRDDARHAATNEYRVPFAPGRVVRVEQGFLGTFSHTGENAHALDFDVPVGTPVHAARAGRVVRVVDSFDRGGDDKKLKDDANVLFIRHTDGTFAEYAHLAKAGVRVRAGQEVKAGQLIALSGSTGYSSGPHLHFMIFRARNGSERESLPFLLLSREGVAAPGEGQEYTAP